MTDTHRLVFVPEGREAHSLTDNNSHVNTSSIVHLASSSVFCKYKNPLPTKITSPVNIKAIRALSSGFPNKELCKYIIDGLQFGFKIGFRGSVSETRPRNNLSARSNEQKVSAAITKEIRREHTSGPFAEPPLHPLHCSPIGSTDKPDGSVRLVMDLSQPEGLSINEGIDKEEFSVRYSHFDEATRLVRMVGKGCYMCKVDIRHAYRLLPVHPSEWNLLGYMWKDMYLVDTVLPFGLRSSAKIFNDFTDMVCWIIQNKYGLTRLIHYSDDFFLVCEPNLENAKQSIL